MGLSALVGSDPAQEPEAWAWAVHAALPIPGLPRPGGGVRITRILDHSPAALAGLRAGQSITAYDGQPVDDLATWQFLRLLAPPGRDSVSLWVDGQALQLTGLLPEYRAGVMLEEPGLPPAEALVRQGVVLEAGVQWPRRLPRRLLHELSAAGIGAPDSAPSWLRGVPAFIAAVERRDAAAANIVWEAARLDAVPLAGWAAWLGWCRAIAAGEPARATARARGLTPWDMARLWPVPQRRLELGRLGLRDPAAQARLERRFQLGLADEAVRGRLWELACRLDSPAAHYLDRLLWSLLDEEHHGGWAWRHEDMARSDARARLRLELQRLAAHPQADPALLHMALLCCDAFDERLPELDAGLAALEARSPWLAGLLRRRLVAGAAGLGLERLRSHLGRGGAQPGLLAGDRMLLEQLAGHPVVRHVLERDEWPIRIQDTDADMQTALAEAFAVPSDWAVRQRGEMLIHAEVANNLAWVYATEIGLIDRSIAARLGEELVACGGRDLPVHALDTQAAVFALLGQYPAAARWQALAIAREGDGENRAEFQRRLALYRAGQAWSEPGPGELVWHSLGDRRWQEAGGQRHGRWEGPGLEAGWRLDGLWWRGQRHGLWSLRDAAGALRMDGCFHEGWPGGPWRRLDAHGVVREAGRILANPLLNPQRSGVWTFRDAGGALRALGSFIDGQPHGPWRVRDAAGAWWTGPCAGGRPVAEWQRDGVAVPPPPRLPWNLPELPTLPLPPGDAPVAAPNPNLPQHLQALPPALELPAP